jgi:DNA primase
LHLPPPGDWKLNGARRVPNRLPELLAEAKNGGVVHIVEGEKDAEAVVRAGEVATCAAGGAGEW